MKVVVGMSGGVDSSVAAYLLKKQGHEVIGLTMKSWQEDCAETGHNVCCGPQAIHDARSVAEHIGIPYYVIEHRDVFKHEIIDYFIDEYNHGRTPNPCSVCNKKLKFGSLLVKAKEIGADKIATGHYAGVREENGRHLLYRAKDREKDQSYFLSELNQYQLKNICFPLEHLNKSEIRNIANDAGLPVKDKEDSQEICFVPNNDYAAFLKKVVPEQLKSGDIVSIDQKIVGQHQGMQQFTIGQRKGLGAYGKPKYVVEIDAIQNKVVIGDDQDLLKNRMTVGRINWIVSDHCPQQIKASVQIRYRHGGSQANIQFLNNKALVEFDEPQRAITPGQVAVFSHGDLVLGGGWIEEALS